MSTFEKAIVYLDHTGARHIVSPSLFCGMTIEEIAAKDVPAGLPFEIVDVSEIVPPAPNVEDYKAAIQSMVDDTARLKDFRDGDALASYFNSTVAPWATQAQAFVAWRDDVWQNAYAELAKVQAGEREQPVVAAFLHELCRRLSGRSSGCGARQTRFDANRSQPTRACAGPPGCRPSTSQEEGSPVFPVRALNSLSAKGTSQITCDRASPV
ncbi:hypothetical protein J2857_003108 [Neorhizobium galegae]|uniref:hypothetical protein n=1 Tax=Neorhizobium galegae TaxID=399 RepID=UPI001AE6DBA9|nr:hypothetical protein [Neorhizobium galegae]MBP2560339.1 hypothetical protein [Neorhizobium galegae]